MRYSRRWLPAEPPILVFVAMLLLAANLSAQLPARARVTIAITKDDLPCSDSKVTIRALGKAEGWPEGKTHITLTTDAEGHSSVELGPGKYLVIAHDPGNTRLPSDATLVIKPDQVRPAKIHLNLLYWDCSKVTCML